MIRHRAVNECVNVAFVAGVGLQFLAIATGVLVMAIMGMFNVHHHGSIDIAVIILYALTSCTLPFHSLFHSGCVIRCHYVMCHNVICYLNWDVFNN